MQPYDGPYLYWPPSDRLGLHLAATRPAFLTASLVPILVGSAWGARQGAQIDLLNFSIALLAMACIHAAVNVFNDVFDDLNGTDRINSERISPFTGGSRMIQNGDLNLRQMFGWGVTLTLTGMALGLVLAVRAGWPIIGLGLAGLALGFAYSAPPIALASRGVGELAVGLGFGALPVIGAAWLQSAIWDPAALLLSLPVGLWIAAVLIVNEIPDITADAASGKRTLAVRLGPELTLALYFLCLCLAIILLFVAGDLGFIRHTAVVLPLGFLGLIAAALLAADRATRLRDQLPRVIRLTLGNHLLSGFWLTGVIALA